MKRRELELEQERHVSSQPPVVMGAALVIPQGFISARLSRPAVVASGLASTPEGRRRIEELALKAVMDAERALGFDPRDVSGDNLGYDIESRVPGTGRLG